MLRRFADARLRSALDRETDKRERAEDKARRLNARLARRLAEATELVRRMDGLLRQKTAEAATNYALAQRWKSIAAAAQDQLAAERARTQETHR